MRLTVNSTLKLLSGDFIPMIGFGTYSLKSQICQSSVKKALECGYRHFDSGSIFKNEQQIKKAIQSLQIPRDQYFLSTKVGPAQQGYKSSIEVCENILKSFQTDYLDLVLIHWPGSNKCTMQSEDNRLHRLETWKGLIELRNSGKVRNIGVSNFMVKHLQHLEESSGERPCLNQFEVHPLLWQQEVIQYCRSKGIVVQAYSPMGKGDPRILKNQTLLQIAQKYNKSVAQICLRWAMQHNFVVIPRSKNPQHIQQNINIYDFQLSKQDMQYINNLKSNNIRINWDGNKVLY